ncbi:MAG: aconitase family protein [Ruthenibacterium lactatiformans]
MDTFIDAGCVVSTPPPGPCLVATWAFWPGRARVAARNRNFVGRMGHTASEVYLASPAVAAASAIAGHIASPEQCKEGRHNGTGENFKYRQRWIPASSSPRAT